MLRTLYLHENQDMRVTRDGPSVWIKRRHLAGRRVPVRLIGRVVIVGRVNLDADVVTLFTARDVPVVFVDRAGDEHAVALPSSHRLPSHYKRQAFLVASEYAAAAFRRWAEEKRRVVQKGVLRRLFPRLRRDLRFGVGEGNYTRLVAEVLPKDEGRRSLVSSVVKRLFAAVVTEKVMRAGLDCHSGVIHRRQNFGFVADLVHAIEAEADLQCVEFFRSARRASFLRKKGRRWEITRSGMKDIAGRFERKRACIVGMVEGVIDEILTMMREVGI